MLVLIHLFIFFKKKSDSPDAFNGQPQLCHCQIYKMGLNGLSVWAFATL